MMDILLIIGLIWLLWELFIFGIGNHPSEETETKWIMQIFGIDSWEKEMDRLERKIERKVRRK